MLCEDTVDAIMDVPLHQKGHYIGLPIISCNCKLTRLDQAKLVKEISSKKNGFHRNWLAIVQKDDAYEWSSHSGQWLAGPAMAMKLQVWAENGLKGSDYYSSPRHRVQGMDMRVL